MLKIAKLKKTILRIFDSLISPSRSFIEMSNSSKTGAILTNFLNKPAEQRKFKFACFRRVATNWGQAWNPFIEEQDLPDIELVIPCHPKDFKLLNAAIEMAQKFSNNPITSVTLITPEKFANQLQSQFANVKVLTDEAVLGVDFINKLGKYLPVDRYGWSIQQILKVKYSYTSKHPGVLIIDSDTLLCSPVTWLTNSGIQRLSFSNEFHAPYALNTEKHWGPPGRSTGMSFVTHFQLFQPEILKSMFPNFETDLIHWMSVTNWNEASAFSEYHSYGTWLLNNAPERVRLASWGNRVNFKKPKDITKSISAIRDSKLSKKAGSVSFHSYLD